MCTPSFNLTGEFKSWHLNGFGEIWYPDNSRWAGEWFKGPVGFGVLTSPDGQRFIAELEDVLWQKFNIVKDLSGNEDVANWVQMTLKDFKDEEFIL